MNSYCFMRAMVIFDLPVLSKQERRMATQFRKALLDDGFEMLQYSVYTRLCPNRDNAETHLSRIKRFAPKTGSIRMLMLTENQYNTMSIISGERTPQEEVDRPIQLAFF